MQGSSGNKRVSQWIDKYNMYRKIHTGAASTIFKGTDQTDPKDVAIKVFKKNNSCSYKEIATEIAFTRILNHANIIEIKDFVISENNAFMVLELSNKGNLENYIQNHGPLPEAQVQEFTKQISSALIYMHNLNLIHGMVETDNVLLVGNSNNIQLKLSDFGKTTILAETQGPSSSTSTSMKLDKTTDIFALGIIVYKMFFKKNPFNPSMMFAHYPFMKKLPVVHYPTNLPISSAALDFIRTCFDYEKRKSFSAKNLIAHPFLKEDIIRGVFFGDCFKTLGGIVTEAIEMINKQQFGLALVGFTEALLLIQIKNEETFNPEIKTFILLKIKEYSDFINNMEFALVRQIKMFPLDRGVGEWEKIRHLVKGAAVVREALDMGFIGESLLRVCRLSALKNLRKAVINISEYLNVSRDVRYKYALNVKLSHWGRLIEQYGFETGSG